jgi:hypothetical protein
MDQEALIRIIAIAALIGACHPKDKSDGTDASVSTPASVEIVPPAAFSAVPVGQFADAGDIDGKPPYEQAKEYFATGQLWKARLILESQALSEGATAQETELLANICNRQGDQTCVEKCSTKLGRKLKFDGGVAPGTSAGGVHQEPDTDLSRARDLFLKGKLDEAHQLLEPKVLDGKASKEETRMLKTICDKEGNRMCVALCNSKLK